MPPGSGYNYPGELAMKLKIVRLEAEVARHAAITADMAAVFHEAKLTFERKAEILQARQQAGGSSGASTPWLAQASASLDKRRASRSPSVRNVLLSEATGAMLHAKEMAPKATTQRFEL